MEVPIRVAVRIGPYDQFIRPQERDRGQGQDQDRGQGLVVRFNEQDLPVAEGRRVNRVFESHEDTATVYAETSLSQVDCLLDGCDTSVVLFGQHASGKTYTLIGDDYDWDYPSWDDEFKGMIPRYVHDVFSKLETLPERNFIIHITWMKVVNGGIVDLLGCGLVRCRTERDVLQYLSKAYPVNEKSEPCHKVFTLSIEQKWVDSGGILHHRLSTASFCELSAHPDPGLYALENVIYELSRDGDNKNVNYEQSLLTAMLKDSFGGRAYTWIICCLNTNNQNLKESLRSIEFSIHCQNIVNYITVNGFADNNTPVLDQKSLRGPEQIFGLQFAAQQWIKLVSNAEELFQKILRHENLSKEEIAQINEWLFLKAECDECLNPKVTHNCDDANENNKHALPRITEDTEPSELSENSDEDSDASNNENDFLIADKLGKYMDCFTEKTDELFLDRCEEYLHCEDFNNSDKIDVCVTGTSAPNTRRKTIHPGESLTGSELEILRKAAAKAISPESQQIILESHKKLEDPESKLVQRELLKIVDSPVPNEQTKKYRLLLQKYSFKQNLIAKLSKEIEDAESQLEELSSICLAEQQLIKDLTKIIKRQSISKRLPDSSNHIRGEYEKAKSDLVSAQTKYIAGENNDKLSQEVEKFKSVVDHYEKKIEEIDVKKKIDIDNHKEIKKHEHKFKTCKKEIEQVKKLIKRNLKKKSTLEIELIKDKSKLDEFHGVGNENKIKEKKQNTFKHVSARISHLDNVLKEKTSDLNKTEIAEDSECMLRREICNLRKTRECLIDERCALRNKRKVYKSLSDTEERKMLECEEAIEAIDTAIECKNELICGRVLLKDNARIKREKGEEMLMQRLSKLTNNEMKTLLYRYFQKVIDLRSTCAGLEATAVAAQRDAGGWRRRCADAWSALHHARLMHARRTTTLTARHYHTLNKLMREMSGDVESDNSSVYGNICARVPFPLAIPSVDDTETTEFEKDNIVTHHSRIAATMAKIKLKEESGKDNKIVGRMMQGRNLERYAQNSIPSQNLRQLRPTCDSPITKVTREKNKLVIVQQEKSKK